MTPCAVNHFGLKCVSKSICQNSQAGEKVLKSESRGCSLLALIGPRASHLRRGVFPVSPTVQSRNSTCKRLVIFGTPSFPTQFDQHRRARVACRTALTIDSSATTEPTAPYGIGSETAIDLCFRTAGMIYIDSDAAKHRPKK